ncbi:MAG: diguanylate cyclase [Magnetococcales bacterium]|nr:diguanylate cyclase [Magnetococcales bacterium]
MNASWNQLDDLVRVLATTMADRDSLQSILDAMVNAVLVISPEATIVRANQAAAELLEHLDGGLVGGEVDQVLAQGRSWRESCMVEMERHGAIRNRETWFVTHTGRRMPVLFSASVIRSRDDRINGYVCSAQDISEHVHLREALRASQESFQAIVEKSADGVLIISRDGAVHYVNPAAERLLGRSASELRGSPFGHPMIDGDVTEVDVVRKNGKLGIAEMRMMETVWHDAPAFLVSLRDVTENVQLRERLRQMSMEDALTGLNNRRGFMLLAEQELKMARRTRSCMLLFFIDLDGMKGINDTLGHKAGDQALLETAVILRQVFRKSDVLARQGGDEFLALSFLESRDDPDVAKAGIIRRIQEETTSRNGQPGRSYALSLSVGSTLVTPGGPSVDTCIQQADASMYQAKLARRGNRIQ